MIASPLVNSKASTIEGTVRFLRGSDTDARLRPVFDVSGSESNATFGEVPCLFDLRLPFRDLWVILDLNLLL